MIGRALIALALLLGTLPTLGVSTASGNPATSAWMLTLTPMPGNFPPGGHARYLAIATNVGAKETEGQITFKATLPGGLLPLDNTVSKDNSPNNASPLVCAAPSGQTITCTGEGSLHPGRLLSILIEVEVLAGEGEDLEARASIEGGGAAAATSVGTPTHVSSQLAPFEFLPGFATPANEADDAPTVLAGAHPSQLTVALGFPTLFLGEELGNSGHPRNIRFDLPRGLVGDPAATPALCTEAELTSELTPGCPAGSQVGLVDLTTQIAEPGTGTSPLYNMVPPPGAVAELAFNALSVGIFVHLIVGVRTDSDYGAYSTTKDILAIGAHPIFNVQTQLWGDPSGKSHDSVRGYHCLIVADSCQVTAQQTPFLTMPDECGPQPLRFEAFADDWEEPGIFRETAYGSADLQGNPVTLEDCAALTFEPTIQARPTTNVTDSPSGLDFDLHQPQQEPEEEPLAGRATATLKDTTVTFPRGLAVNPSQATGLDACSEAQIGFTGTLGGGAPRFSKAPQSCPDAAKIGTLEAASPLLAEYNEDHEVERDPETAAAISRPLHGSVYLAQPFANPFGSLIAAYFAIEDEKTGIVAKFASEGQLDSATGQLTVHIKESPELPVEDFHVHVFGGDRGAFITPPTCAAQETTTLLTPWGAPEAPSAQASDSFAPSAAPGGGPCPATEAQMPNAPALRAGTVKPRAGKYSPLTFKLSRADGSQRLARVEATLPSGLIGKLADVAQCPQAGIAKAISREAPNQGAAEQADPSCPAQSEVGTVSAGVGAGPSPYYASGHVYLAGPYKDAPLSFAIIAPAVAGPFDLGTVVNRVTVYLDHKTAQVRAVSEPLPQLLDGIPLDLRSVSMQVKRPRFVLNPTSCDERQFTGTATSALGQLAPLTQRFQVGGCKSLPYKPRFSARLFGPTHRGAHPSLHAVFTAKPGEANTARASFALPHTEFLDQAHLRTICTRVQFAAHACPAGAIYGHARVVTPLLDSPLEGPVYLRSSTHELPDLILALHGPPAEPIEVDLDGRIDSVDGGVRATFPSVPDAPVSKLIVVMQGARKGVFQNSTNICIHPERATLKLDAQNGKTHDTRPLLAAQCGKAKKAK